MNAAIRKNFTGPLLVLGLFIGAAVTLRFARDFFLPLVLAGLLSFLLSPLVRRLERWRLGRVGAVLVTAALAFVLIGGLTYLVTSQFLDLARSLAEIPQQPHRTGGGAEDARKQPAAPRGPDDQRRDRRAKQAGGRSRRGAICGGGKNRVMRVEVLQPADVGSIQMLMGVLWPVVGPLANTWW
jgi:hypothetical protein